MQRVLLALATVCAAAQAWSIKDRGPGIDSVETTFQTRLKGGGKGVTLTYVLAARGDAVDARLNTTNWTPMHVAAQGGNAAVVEYLLGQGADPNAAGVDPTPDRPPNQVGPARGRAGRELCGNQPVCRVFTKSFL